MRLTVAQALVRFLAAQYTERDGVRAAADRRLLRHLRARQRRRRRAGAARAAARRCPSTTRRNEQAMVHAAAGYARHEATGCRRSPARRRSARARRTWSPARRWPRSTACRCCCCRATCSPRARPAPVLQELEDPTLATTSRSTTASSPVSRFWDRDQPPRAARRRALLAAMRVLTDPAETGAVTLALPQDVQAEAFDWPEELFERARLARAPPAARAGARWPRRSTLLRGARRPLIVVRRRHDLRRGDRRAARAGRGDRHPAWPRRRPARARCPTTTRSALGAIGATGTTAANALAREADVDPRRRHALERLHHRLAQPVRRADARVRQPQRRARSTRSSTPALPLVADARARPRGARARRSRAGRRPGTRARRARHDWDAIGRARRTRSATARCRPRARSSASSTASPSRATSSSAPPARCPATCTSCGARATRRATTSSTASRAWATRSPAGSGVKLAAPDREVVRDGRRRLVPDDGPGDRHRRAGGHQAHDRPRPEPRLRSRSARCRSPSARSASAPSTATAAPTTRSCRSTSRPTPRRLGADVRRAPRTIEEFEAALREAAARRASPSSRSTPTRSSARPTPRRGGTCPSPRSPRWSPPAPRARRTSRTSARSGST